MTVEALNVAPPYTIAGVGPYTIPHAYVAEDLIVSVGPGAPIVLEPGVDFVVAPAFSETAGDVTLSVAAAAAHVGLVLTIERYTTVEQGWQGTAGPREKGLERQLDELARGIQDAAGRGRRALVLPVGATVDPVLPVLRPGHTLVADPTGQRLVEGPDAGQIGRAQEIAQEAAATTAASAAAAETARLGAEVAREGAEAVFAAWRVEIFDGDGATTGFELVYPPEAIGNTFVTVGGAVLTPGVDYHIDADNPRLIVLEEAAASATGNVAIRYGRVILGAADGREVELQTSGAHVQWRYVADASWANLVALADLKGGKGDKGDKGDPGNSFTIAGDVAAAGDLPADAAPGAAWRVGGLAGDIHVKLPAGGYLNLGPIGGADGREVELGASATHVRWRHVGETDWTDIVPLADLAGADAYIPNAGAFAAAGDERWLRRNQGLGDLNNVIAARAALGVAEKQSGLTDATGGRGMLNGAHGLGSALPPAVPSDYATADVVTVTCLLRVSAADNPDAASAAALKLPVPGAGHVNTIRFNSTYAEQDFISVGFGVNRGRRWRREQAAGVWGGWRPETPDLLLEHFGAVGDGATDDTAAIAAAMNSGQPVKGLAGRTYRIMGPIAVAGKAVDFDGNGCTILCEHHTAAIDIEGGYSEIRAISSIAKIETDATSTGRLYSRLTLASGGGNYARGDILKVVDETIIPFAPAYSTGPRLGARQGEFTSIQHIAGNVLHCLGHLFYEYTSTPRLAKLNKSKITLRNFTVTNPHNITPSNSYATPLTIRNAYRPELRDIRVGQTYNNALAFRSCYAPFAENLLAGYGADMSVLPWSENSAPGIDGDVLELSTNYHARVTHCHFSNSRHGVTTGAGARTSADGNAMQFYGTEYGGEVSDCTGTNTSGPAFDTHEGTRQFVFRNCKSSFGSGYGFAFRGVDISGIGCESFCDRVAVHVFHPSYQANGQTTMNKWINGRIINPVRQAFLIAATSGVFQIQGGYTHLIGGVSQNGETYASVASELFYFGNAATTYLENHSIYARNADLASLGQIILLATAGAHVRINNLGLDTSETGLEADLILARADGSNGVRILDFSTRVGSGDRIKRLVVNPVASFVLGNVANASGDAGVIASNYAIAQLVADGNIILPCSWSGEYVVPRSRTSIAAAPRYVGQIAHVAGAAYIATGAATPADWTAIT